jgi:hypothetical protein
VISCVAVYRFIGVKPGATGRILIRYSAFKKHSRRMTAQCDNTSAVYSVAVDILVVMVYGLVDGYQCS